ncbi:hypothetical protein BWQ96_03769 [Gracilariopsis chorda]|uniref:Uncharacterized protein n=1 Tax=Gracilariopsis chorda TaxID=448386 RepID=A0A2V3IWC1_9FLOR|nr:hypothetical protein BWQ96_03769 [Gracilariopsis chorda]|eukprot:PXF46444.1 hypothetical protein BWQ96_03769 [Gracilariopsis chorda]
MPSVLPIRSCNKLEAFFATHNVRFAIGTSFVPRQVPRVQTAIEKGVLSHPALQYELAEKETSIIRRRSQPVVSTVDLDSPLEDALERIVHNKDAEKRDVRIFLLTRGGEGIGLVLDFNHALCDAKTMQDLLCSFYASLAGSEFKLRTMEYETDWVVLVKRSLDSLPTREDDPAFLPFSEACVSSTDVLCGDQANTHISTRPADIRVDIPLETVLAVRTELRKSGGTLTGLWVFCLQQAIEKIYHENNEGDGCCVSVSVLVDLRPFLPESSCPPQAFGTVAVSRVVRRDGERMTGDAVRQGAAEMSGEVRRRVARGEAHRAALALCEGRFQESGPGEATVELSNHGVYNLGRGGEVWATQRNDGYKGCSCILFSENHSGRMRMIASWGGLNERLVRQAVRFAHEVFVMAAT